MPARIESRSLPASSARLPQRCSPWALLVGLVLVVPLAAGWSRAQAKTPNVVVIMADDLGYGDLSCYGATRITTPNIDRLASEGVRFRSGYCSASTCTPTRYSLLTGTYAFRVPRTGIAPPNAPAIIRPGTETIATILKRAGYATAVIGKWHLGLGGESGPDWNGELKPGPLEIGFDTCFLLPTTNDRVPQVFVRDRRVPNLDPADPLWVGDKKPSDDHPTGITHRDTLKMDWSHGHNATIHNGISRIGFYTGGTKARFRDEDLGDHWLAESTRFIESNRDRPFFLFFASHDIHVPRIPHERFQGTTELGFRGDSIAQFDDAVGHLMKTLDRCGLTDKTLVIVCSDNGPVLDDGYQDGALEKNGDHLPAGPFSGGKYSIYEGGTRTPLITRWPGHIRPGVSDEIVCTIDLAASLAAITGQTVPEDACLDSFDLSAALLGQPDAKGREHLVQQDNGTGGTFGFRSGPWKLHRHDGETARNVDVRKELANSKVPRFRLFNLDSDPGEKDDLLASHPEIAERMQRELDDIITRGRSRR